MQANPYVVSLSAEQVKAALKEERQGLAHCRATGVILRRKIMSLLPATEDRLCSELAIDERRLCALLSTLRKQRAARKVGEHRWDLVGISEMNKTTSKHRGAESAHVRIVRAEQLGMRRDDLVAALFGDYPRSI